MNKRLVMKDRLCGVNIRSGEAKGGESGGPGESVPADPVQHRGPGQRRRRSPPGAGAPIARTGAVRAPELPAWMLDPTEQTRSSSQALICPSALWCGKQLSQP